MHERIIVDGSIGNLRTPLEHHTIRTLEQHRDKIRYYTELTTRLGQESGKRSSLTKAALHGGWAFLRGYVFKGGFLDGSAGFNVASGQAKSVWWRYKAIARGTSPGDARRVEVQSSVADGSPSMVNRAGWPNQLLMLASPYLSLRTFTTSFMSASESTHPL